MKKTKATKKTRNQGQVANAAGKWHERRAVNFLKDLIEDKHVLSFSTGMKQQEPNNAENCFIMTEPTFTPYYGGSITKRSDILVNFFDKHLVRIECKYQNVAGSVEEKILSTIENLKLGETVGQTETICVLFLDGAHWTDNPAVDTRVKYYRDDLNAFNRSSKKKVYLVVGNDEYQDLMTTIYLEASKKAKAKKTRKSSKKAA